MPNEWQPISTASHGPYAPEVLVGVHVAGVWIVRNAIWINADEWFYTDEPGEDEYGDGWWAYRNSVGQEMLEGIFEPQWWMPMPKEPKWIVRDPRVNEKRRLA